MKSGYWGIDRFNGILRPSCPADIRPSSAVGLSGNALGIRLLDQAKEAYPTLFKSWVDTGFKNAVVEHGARLGIDVEVVDRNSDTRGFHVARGCWGAERSIGWVMRHRRLARDYETLTAGSEVMIHIVSIDNLAKRMTDETTSTRRSSSRRRRPDRRR